MKKSSFHPFKSAKAKARYLRLYTEWEKSWPVESEQRTLETPSGTTFLRISGPPEAPPLVLLPSASATSLFWRPNICGLSEHYRVYALDNIYDFGRSVYKTPFKTIDNYMSWLNEVFDELGLKKDINLVGLSYGAFLISQYVLKFPERLAKSVWIAPPATFFQLPGVWAWYGIQALIPHRYFLRKMMIWMFPELTSREDSESRKLADNMIEEAFVGLRCFKLKMPVNPTVLTDDELKSITVPTLFLVGEKEVIYSADKAIERVAEFAPRIQGEIIPQAGHDLTIVQADLVNQRIRSFLESDL